MTKVKITSSPVRLFLRDVSWLNKGYIVTYVFLVERARVALYHSTIIDNGQYWIEYTISFTKETQHKITSFSLPVLEASRSTASSVTAAETTIIVADKQKKGTSNK